MTLADTRCEAATIELLTSLRDIPVVGEESTESNPGLMDALQHDAWIVDPIDGTSNFVAGSPDYAVMVALVEGGDAVASWIWLPATETMAYAERRGGAYVDGRRVQLRPADMAPAVLKRRFMPERVAERADRALADLGPYSEGSGAAGVDYPRLIAGGAKFLMYWRTLPWDHAPGVLFATEAGAAARRPDGSAYAVATVGSGLIVGDPDVVDHALAALFD